MIVADNDTIELFGSTVIGWNYPEIYDDEAADTIVIHLIHTRAVRPIRLRFDSDRDGYVIDRQTVFEWSGDDSVCDPGWEEIACIHPWFPHQDSV